MIVNYANGTKALAKHTVQVGGDVSDRKFVVWLVQTCGAKMADASSLPTVIITGKPLALPLPLPLPLTLTLTLRATEWLDC